MPAGDREMLLRRGERQTQAGGMTMTIWEQVRWYLLALAILGVSVSLWFNHRTIAEHGRVQAWTVY